MPARGFSVTAPTKRDGSKRKQPSKRYIEKKAAERLRRKVDEQRKEVRAGRAKADTGDVLKGTKKPERKKKSLLGTLASGGPNALLAGAGKQALRAGKNIVVATAEAPGAVAKNTAKGARDTAAAIPAGIVKAATTRPDKTVKAIIDDYEERYGQSDEEQQERFKKEGITPEILDALGVASAGGATSGRIISNTASKGALGARAKAVATAPRPALRTTGGKATPQLKSRNYFKAEVQVARDNRRAAKTAKASKDEPLDAVRAAARQANEQAGKVVEVVPSARKVAKAQRVRVATTKGRAVQKLKAEQIRVVEKTARRLINQFDDMERAAFYHVASGTVSADPARAAKQLARRREAVLAARNARKIGTPDGLRKKTDELSTIDKLLADPVKGFTPRVRDTVEALRAVDLHAGRQDPTLTPRQRVLRRYSQQAETLGLRRGEGGEMYNPDETTSQFIRRVQKAADDEGLSRPLYFPSEKYAIADNPDFASRAVGGARATKPSFQYTGELFRTGRQDTTPEVFLTGLARTIKRKHNWQLVASTLDEHAFKGLTNKRIGQLKEGLVDMGADTRSVAFWNPGLFRERLRGVDVDAPEHKNLDAEERAALVQEGEDFAEAQTNNALASSLVLPEQITPEMRAGGGWSVVPRAAYDEIMQATRPSGAKARAWDISKSKQSRILLGTLNIPWLGFQVASNALLTTAATHGRVLPALVEQHRWYKRLTTEQRDLVDSLVGDSASHSSAGRTHMGAASNATIVNQYRALKANPIWDRQLKGTGPSLRQLNPIEAMFALDRTQNNAFRRAVLHDRMKRAAAQDMAHSVTSLRSIQDDVVNAIKGRPEEVVSKMLRNRDTMEAHAKYVDDWLGNWTTFTAAERAVGNRFLMFYPYLRFSLKLAFQTLPAQHPVLLSMAGKLGQLQQDELERLGVEDLPWAAGRLYFKRDGKLMQVDLARMNPLMNAASSTKEPSQIFGVLPPVVQALVVDQLTHKSSFKDKEWTVKGKPAEYGAQGSDYGMRVRGRIALDDLLSLAYPYRAAKTQVLEGPQSDDALLWSPRPMKYTDKKIQAAIKKSIERKAEERSVVREVLPLLGEPTDDPEVAQSRRDRDKPKRKKERGFGGGFDSGGFGGGFGGGGF